MRVLVTGPGGFVGRTLVPLLEARGHDVVRAGRAEIGELGPDTRWDLAGIEAVVHLAAKVHDPNAAPETFDRVNRAGTARLAEAARRASLRRLVFLSSVKAASDDPYGCSKRDAEAALSGVPAVILRPPLVHGPGVRGNFQALLKLCRSGLPLPLGAVANRRSLVAVQNLADAVVRSLEGTATGTYGVRDIDLATPDLVRRLRAAMGLPPRLVPVPPGLLRQGAGLLGKKAAAERLLGSLVVDDAAFRRDFGWAPPRDPLAALAETARSVL